MSRRSCRLGLAAAFTMMALVTHPRAAEAPNADAAAAMDKFLARPAISHQYRAWRRLEASGVGQRAWMDARTDFTLASGLQYEVTAEGGSGYIRTRILRSLLEEEQQLIARGGASGVALSTDNYKFTPQGVNNEGLAVVDLKPLRKDRSLIIGQMFLTPFEGELVRVEGRLAKNPSFWVTRVNIVRSYRRIDGALMPVLLETAAQLRLLGASVLRMTYRYSDIDERPVDDEQAD